MIFNNVICSEVQSRPLITSEMVCFATIVNGCGSSMGLWTNFSKSTIKTKDVVLVSSTAWKVSKYGQQKTPYLDTFHTVFIVDFELLLVHRVEINSWLSSVFPNRLKFKW